MAKKLNKVVEQLKGAVIAHGKQAKVIEDHIKEMKDGPSFFGKLREKINKKKDTKQAMEESRNRNQSIMSGIIPNPSSNGTGSARPNFNSFAQNAIGNVMGGQKMGNALGFRQGVNDKLDKVLQAVQGNAAGNDAPQTPGMPPADPMTTTPGDRSMQDVNEANAAMMNMDMGATMAAKPKQVAKAQAKEYANKKGLRGKARKELIKDAKRSQSFDAAAQDEKSGDKPVSFGGSMNGDTPKYTYTTSDSKGYAKQKRKDYRKKKNVSMSKMNRLGKKQAKETGFYSGFEGEKTKMVSRKKAEKLEKRGWQENMRM